MGVKEMNKKNRKLVYQIDEQTFLGVIRLSAINEEGVR
jgi:hypothetical protein